MYVFLYTVSNSVHSIEVELYRSSIVCEVRMLRVACMNRVTNALK